MDRAYHLWPDISDVLTGKRNWINRRNKQSLAWHTACACTSMLARQPSVWDYTLQAARLAVIRYSDTLSVDGILYIAASDGHLETCRFMFALFPKRTRLLCAQLLCQAAGSGHLEVCKFLKTVKMDKSGYEVDFIDAFMHAVDGGHVDVCKFLYTAYGMTVEDVRSDENYALRWAAGFGYLHVLQFLKGLRSVKIGNKIEVDRLTVNDVRSKHNQALHYAMGSGHLEIVKFFIAWRDDDPNSDRLTPQDFSSETNFHQARWNDRKEVYQYLTDWHEGKITFP